MSHAISAVVFLLFASAFPLRAQSIDIVAFGASNTYGKGVARSEAYPHHLGQMPRARGIAVMMLRNRLIKAVAATRPRPDGQHFLSAGYRALAARLLPRVLKELKTSR